MSSILSNYFIRCIIKHPPPAALLITLSGTTINKSPTQTRQQLDRSLSSSYASVFSRALSTQAIEGKSPPVQKVSYANVYYWRMERTVAAAVYTTLPIGIMFPHMVFDILLTVLLPVHFSALLHQIVLDYCNKTPILAVVMNIAIVLLTTANFVALGYFNSVDVGITSALHSLLTL